MIKGLVSSVLVALAVAGGVGLQPSRGQEAAGLPVAPPAVVVSSLDSMLATSLDDLKSAADKGDAAAALAVARAYFANSDPDQQTEGVAYLELAANGGARGAIEQLGDLYSTGGYGIAPDPIKARAAYEKAVEAGSVDALAALGRLLLNSDFSPAGQQRGIGLLEQAVKAGQVGAANSLGQIYLDGRGVPADAQKALYYFSLGLVNGSGSALLGVGDALRTGTRTLAANPAVALQFFQRAAAAGDSSAARRIADMHVRGEAVTQDVAAGEKMLADLAAGGDAESFVALGDLYRDGEFVAVDAERAVGYYEKAMELNNNSGATRLASLYMTGAPGVAINVRQSLDYYEQAKERGSTSAMRSLADLYLKGSVVAPNPQEAIELLQRAAAFGDSSAAETLSVLYAGNEPFPSDYDEVKRYLDLTLAMGNTRAVLGVATAIAEGPLARAHGEDAYQLLSGAVSSGVPGAAARLARLQLDGRFPAQGLDGVMSMLNKAALGGDQAAARFLLGLYRDGYGLLLKPDAKAADTFLAAVEPVLGVEGTAMEKITIAALRGESAETLETISGQYGLLSKLNAVSALNNLRRVNARAYVYVVQKRLAAMGLYQGALSGTLDNVTIRAFRAGCEQAAAAAACAPGPLTSGTAQVLGNLIWGVKP